HLPCPCGKSSDAYAIDATDGHGHCFSCGKNFPRKGVELGGLDDTSDKGYTFEYVARRGISKETHEFFGVKTAINAEGRPVSVAYVYPNKSTKIRRLEPKSFYTLGDFSAASGWG